jgi:hypothetical protein
VWLVHVSFCRDIQEIEQSSMDQVTQAKHMKLVRQRGICTLYEILKYPSTLKENRVNQLFTVFLMATQKKSSLKLVDQILPGRY